MAAETAQAIEFVLPSLGSDMEEGTVLTWLVEPGDQVAKGDVLLRVDTEKAEIDVEVWHDAVVLELLVGPGDTVPVGSALARLETGAGSVAVQQRPTEPVAVAAKAPVVATAPRAAAASAIPAADPVAADRAIDLAAHQATPRMVYWPSPVRQTEKTSHPQTRSRADRRQSAVAALMERSNREIPHFHLHREIDLTEVLAWLDRRNDAVSPTDRILPAAVLLYAVAHAAASSPVNGTFDGGSVEAEHVDLGVAVHVRGGGLMTPVLPVAEVMALDTLMWELQAMVGRARASRLSTRDMTPASLTVTNLGDAGADVVLGVIRPPERALVGFGRIAERPAVVDGELAVRSTVQVTLTADHRTINGQAGARFLDALNVILTNPDDINLAGAPT